MFEFFGPKLDVEQTVIFSADLLSSKMKIKTHCDKEYGGESECRTEVMHDADAEESFLRYTGNLHFDESHALATNAKAGYCSMKVSYARNIDLRNYEGLEIIMRSKHNHTLALTMVCDTYLIDDVYQIKYDLQGGDRWLRVVAPFHAFQLTQRGVMSEKQRENDLLLLQSFGLLSTTQDANGAFEIDVLKVTALPVCN